MTRALPWLSSLLFVQLGLMAWLNQSPKQTEATQFVAITEQVIEQVTLEESGNQLTLKAKGDAWILPQYADLSVDAKKITQLLDAFAPKNRLPVATSAQSQRRFEVSDDAYQRKLTLTSSEGSQVFYVGQQAGVKQSYVRQQGTDYIYELPLVHHELSAQPKDWFARDLLRMDNINAIEGKDFKLVKQDERWVLESLSQDLEPNQENIDVITTQLQYINAQELAAPKELGEIKAEFKVYANEVVGTYSLYKLNDRWLVKSDLNPHAFYVASPFGQSMQAWERKSFIQSAS